MSAVPASDDDDSRPASFAQDEILTGEAVALDVQPIGFFLRLLGGLIDVVATVLVLLAVALGATWALGAGAIPEESARIAGIAALVAVLVVVPIAVETLSGGRSLGRWAVGARIVRADGGSSGLRQAFVRALLGVFEIWMTLGVVAALSAAFTPRAQRLGDLLAGTYSERTRTPRLGEVSAPVPPALTQWAQVADVARLPDPLARRCAQFLTGAGMLEPPARARTAQRLASELAGWVSPLPDVDAESFVRGVVAVRRDREVTALRARDDRAARLLPRR